MTTEPKTIVSARINTKVADRLQRMAKARGVTRSELVEELLQKGTFTRMEYSGRYGSLEFELVGELNARHGRALNHEHPAIEIWECVENVSPRHFLHVFAEYDEDEGRSSEAWLLWRGSEIEQINLDDYIRELRLEEKGMKDHE